MRAAKIGQLTTRDHRSLPVDRPDSLNAQVLVGPSAQRAWLCGGDSGVSFEDVCDSSDRSQDKNDAAVMTMCLENALTEDIGADIAESSSPITLEILGRDDKSSDYLKNFDEKLLVLDSLTSERDTDKNSQTEDRSRKDTDEISSSSCGPTIANNTQKETFRYNKSGNPASEERCEDCSSNNNISWKLDYKSEQAYRWNGPVLDTNDKICKGKCEDKFSLLNNARKKSFERIKYSTPPAEEVRSSPEAEISMLESGPCLMYANFLKTESCSLVGDHELKDTFSNDTNCDQILSVKAIDCYQNRLSHQYLNSSVTRQSNAAFLPDPVVSYRCMSQNCTVVNYPGSDRHTNMIFPTAQRNDIRFSDTGFHPSQPSSNLAKGHYYNSKGSFSEQNVEGINTSMNNPKSRQYSPKAFKNCLVTKDDNHGNRSEQELDLKLFRPLPQLHCPAYRASPLASPYHNFHQHHQEEQQHLLNHNQPRYQDHQYMQHHHHRHYSTNSISTLIRHIGCGHCRFRISPVSLLWTFLSVLVAGICLLSFLTPYWTIHPDHVHAFGLFNLCIRDQRFSHPRPLCMNFGHRPSIISSLSIVTTTSNNISDEAVFSTGSVDIARIPSGAWQAACLLFGVGVLVQILGAIVSLFVLMLQEPWHHRMALINGYMQTVGVLLLLSGLVLYPVGFSSPFYSYYCDSSRAFCAGHCAMGWSYVTAIMATALSIFCPVMSSFVDDGTGTRKSLVIVETATA